MIDVMSEAKLAVLFGARSGVIGKKSYCKSGCSLFVLSGFASKGYCFIVFFWVKRHRPPDTGSVAKLHVSNDLYAKLQKDLNALKSLAKSVPS